MKKILTCIAILLSQFSYGQNLGLPAFAEGAPNNYFTQGNGDGGNLEVYNVLLKLHSGMAIGSPYADNGYSGPIEKATIAFNARSGNIAMLGTLTSTNAYINNSVAIGTNNPMGYRLAVAGAAIAESVTVKVHIAWPDYVFNKDYKLLSLKEVSNYINKNHHLPDMPSAKEVALKGIDLGEMNKLLTLKVEELTLHLIEKDKEVNGLQSQMESVINQGKEQQKQINELRELLTQQSAKSHRAKK